MTPDPTTPPHPFLEVPENVPRAYANFIAVEPGGMDVTIAMGHQAGTSPPQWSVRVTMPWEEGKFLAEVLEHHLALYASSYGDVREVMKKAEAGLAKAQAEAAAQPEEAKVSEMTDYAEIGRASAIARVSYVSESGQSLVLEYRNGMSASVSFLTPTTDYVVGDVVFVRAEENWLEPAPPEVWEDELWIAVVRLRLEDITIVDQGGRLRRLPTVSDVEYADGNTVECTDRQIIRVLAQEPIRTIDIRQPDEVNVDAFKTQPAAEGREQFEDFGGMHDIVERARELVKVPLQYRDALRAIGARSIRGVLFTGPPGTGKTMLARIIANEAAATFYAISGPSIFSKWFGESQDLLRRIFADAADQSRSIIFFDEIDSVAVRRSEDAHEESKRVVAQLLTLMDGFDVADNVIVIAATNRPEAIDEALRRPGRFDWEIEFRAPSLTERIAILVSSSRGIATEGPLPHAFVAVHSEGWSGADLSAIWSEAALLAVVDDREVIVAEDYLGGYDRVVAQRMLRMRTQSSSRPVA